MLPASTASTHWPTTTDHHHAQDEQQAQSPTAVAALSSSFPASSLAAPSGQVNSMLLPFQHSLLLPPTALLPIPPAAPPLAVTHNLIPTHLRGQSFSSPLQFGSPGFPPSLVGTGRSSALAASTFAASSQPEPASSALPLTVQDRPMVAPVYNGINPNYPGARMVSSNPPVFTVDDFLSPQECDFLIQVAQDSFTPAPVVGKGAGEVSPSRTSSTCYLAREDLPDYLRKVSMLTGKPIEHCELPQVGRYFPSQQYLQHFDAFDLSNEDGVRFAANGGQRVVTVLVYLNDVQNGGQTHFPALEMSVQPKRGMALVFFPATVDGLLDKMALHAALPSPQETKYVSQVWIRQSAYQGQPSKRLPQTMGLPFNVIPPPTVPLPAEERRQIVHHQDQQLHQQLQLQEHPQHHIQLHDHAHQQLHHHEMQELHQRQHQHNHEMQEQQQQQQQQQHLLHHPPQNQLFHQPQFGPFGSHQPMDL